MEEAGSNARRSTRTRVVPSEQPKMLVVEPKPKGGSTTGTKRKLKDPENTKNQLEFLLSDPKSPLTTMNIFDIVNYENFISLSQESQDKLCALLPPTAFITYQPSIDPTHPSLLSNSQLQAKNDVDMDIDTNLLVGKQSTATLDPSVLTSSFFQSAALTFQDHLYSSRFSRKAKETEEQCGQGLRDGGMHADWKDEVWERDNDVQALSRNTYDTDLASLARRSLIREGDVIGYVKKFNNDIVVEKDLLVRFVNPDSHAITFLLQPTTTKNLPPDMLVIGPPAPQPPTLTMEDILSSVELESEVLDIDGRVSRAERYASIQEEISSKRSRNDNDPFTTAALVISVRAAKSLSVWRWREEMQGELELQMIQDRGGREKLGTVYHLRNS